MKKERDKIARVGVDGGLLERRGKVGRRGSRKRCQRKSKPAAGARDPLPTTLRNLDHDFLQEKEEGEGREAQCW